MSKVGSFFVAILLAFSIVLSSCGKPEDVTKPTVKILVPQEGKIYSPQLVIRGIASDNNLKRVYVQIDSEPWQTATGNVSWMFFPGVLTAGSHRVQVYAIDGAGNKSKVEYVDFYIDKDPPTFVIASPYEGEDFNASDVQVRISATDDLGVKTVYFSLDGHDYFPVDYSSSPLEYTFHDLENGEHVLSVYVVDKSGKKSAVKSVRFIVLVDHTPPEVTIFSPLDGSWFSGGSITVLGSASDDLSGVDRVEVKLDNGDWEHALGTDQWMINIPYISDGVHKIYARSIDRRLNFSQPVSITIYYDTLSPLLTGVSINDNDVISGYSYNVSLSAVDNLWVKEIDYRVYSGGNVFSGTYTYPFLTTMVTQLINIPVNDGVNTLQIEVHDNTGHTVSKSITFFVDNAGPEINAAVDEWYNGSSITINGFAQDEYSPVTEVAVSLDHGPYQIVFSGNSNPASWSFTSGIESGEHTLDVRAFDIFGNMSENSYTFKVDNTPPVVTIGTPQNGTWYSGGDVLFAGRASDDFSGVNHVYISLDGGNTWEETTGTESWMAYYPSLPGGVYHVEVKAVDLVGNESYPAYVTIYYDSTPTIVLSSSITDGETLGVRKYMIPFTATVYDSVSLYKVDLYAESSTGVVSSYSFTYPEFETLATFTVPVTIGAGDNVVHIHTVDRSGNEDDEYISFYVDWFAPVIQITRQNQIPPSKIILNGTISDYSPVTFASYRFDTDNWSVLIENGTMNTYSFALTKDNVGTTEHHLYIKAWDQWGNMADFVYNFYYDVTGPTVYINFPPENGYILGLKSFPVEGTAVDVGSGISEVLYCIDYPCYVTPQANGGGDLFGVWNTAEGAESWKFNVSSLSKGIHYIHVFAIDLAGNYGQATSVSVNIAGDTIYVSSSNGSNYNSGVTTTEPLRTLDYAYEYALLRGFTNIKIAAGNYDVADTSDTSTFKAVSTLKLVNGINLYGGYSTDFTYYDPLTYATLVSTSGKGRVFMAEKITQPTVISGLYIYNGDVTQDTYPYGGGILVKDSNYNLYITSCTIFRNKAVYGGGVAYVNSVPNIEYSRVASNVVYSKGGGMYLTFNYPLEVTFNGMVFAWNEAKEKDEAADGGGVYISGASNVLIKKNTLFYRNRAGNGGGIFVKNSGKVEIAGAIFTGNQAQIQFWSDGYGGGMYVKDVPVEIKGGVFYGNSAYKGGGLYFVTENEDTDLNVDGSASQVIVDSNSADFGGGIYVKGGSSTLNHVVVSRNQSNSTEYNWITGIPTKFGGGGVYVDGGKMRIYYSRFRKNIAQATCGGIAVSQSVVELDHSLVIENYADPNNGTGGGVCVGGDDARLLVTYSSVDTNESNAGGGMVIKDNSRVLIENSSLKDNYATWAGGAIFAGDLESNGSIPRVKVERSIIDGNWGNGGAYGLWIAGSITEYRNVVSNNGGSGNDGGAYYIYTWSGGNMVVNSSYVIYRDNSASRGGVVAVYNYSSSKAINARFENDEFTGNVANRGGVVYVEEMVTGDQVTINWSKIHNNTAYATGSVLYDFANEGLVTMVDNAVYDNTGDYIQLTTNYDAQVYLLNNVFVDLSGNYNLLVLGRDRWRNSYADPVVVNNLFSGGYNQVEIGDSAGDTSSGYYVNNIFFNPANDGVIENNSNTEPEVLLNNDFYNAGNCLYEDYDSSQVPPNVCYNTAAGINSNVDTLQGHNENNMDDDPAFATDGVHLTSSSHLIDAGYDPVNDPYGIFGFDNAWPDIDGQLRPYDDPSVANVVSAWDIGPDEYRP